MVDFNVPAEVFIYILDLFGTMAFAVTGAFKAIESKADIVGIVILATITGVAGGTIRDIVLGKFPPNSIVDPTYVIITVATGVVLFFLYTKLKKHWNVFLKFDAIGLGVFTVIGATFAYNIFGTDQWVKFALGDETKDVKRYWLSLPWRRRVSSHLKRHCGWRWILEGLNHHF